MHTLGTELVDTIGLTHEHDLELLSIRVVVDVLGETLVNLVVLHGDVDSNTSLQVNDVLLEHINFLLPLLDFHLVLLNLEFAFLELTEEL